ncbi:MAG: aminotransferase class I/II-fold pyridoxal phosphate-dependent enzyme [Cytophagales bacterium]|nr:aminotransferase class I/II-fold pyridoxal phosphate-dependent enzyme [Cytophagales bacterium]
MISTASRFGNVQEYYFSTKLRQIAELNEAGRNILNLGIGSPDQAPDSSVIQKLQEETAKEDTHAYQSYKGIPQLRAAFSNWYNKHYNVTLNPETEILPLIGSKEGIFHISMTYLEAGDEVLVPNPGYPTYAAASKLTGATIRSYDLIQENNWLPDIKKLESQDLSRVKLMWVNYPNMPTGQRAPAELLQQLAEFAERNKLVVCNDNPYSFILNRQPLSLLALGLNDHVIELNSLSKSHNMAGWRMGMVAASRQHIDNILRIKSNMDSGMFLPIQLAAIKALELGHDWYEGLNKEYRSRKKMAWKILDLLACKYDQEHVGLFVWAKVPEAVESVEKWIDEIMLGAEVFITPGFIFGSNGARYIRISLCSNQEVFKIAFSRIKTFIAK